jgi:hypothetical protein
MESFSLQVYDEWLSVKNVEEDLQIVELYLFRVVIDANVHLLTW